MQSTSMENRAPPTGALNMPAIPADAPQAIITFVKAGVMPNSRPILLPIAAPAYAIGPSDPADPPNPNVIELARIGEYVSLWVDGIYDVPGFCLGGRLRGRFPAVIYIVGKCL